MLGVEDYGTLLRTHVLVPQRLQLEPDDHLRAITSNRLVSWNHDIVPDYLRTKMNPELENEENLIDMDRNNKGICTKYLHRLSDNSANDLVSRQTQTLNKHVDSLMQTLPTVDKSNEMLDKVGDRRACVGQWVKTHRDGHDVRSVPVNV